MYGIWPHIGIELHRFGAVTGVYLVALATGLLPLLESVSIFIFVAHFLYPSVVDVMGN